MKAICGIMPKHAQAPHAHRCGDGKVADSASAVGRISGRRSRAFLPMDEPIDVMILESLSELSLTIEQLLHTNNSASAVATS